MKLSVRLACIIHGMHGAKNFDIYCRGRGKSHIDARTGDDDRSMTVHITTLVVSIDSLKLHPILQ